ncbi:hypothetical protein ACVW19_006348 [Streptomyces sp. TE5632]
MNRQDRADAVDREMATRLLPDAVLQALDGRWSENAMRYADGTPDAHTVRYVPSRWVQITPWPSAPASTSHAGDAGASRAQVASIVADALRREAFREALVATYVRGKGKRGTPGGSGPATCRKSWPRAVDADGTVLDILIQNRRDTTAARRFFRNLLQKTRSVPRVVITDQPRSYRAAHREVMPSVEHRSHQGPNHRAENSHQPTRQRERAMKGFAASAESSGSWPRSAASHPTSGPAAT